MRLGDNVYDLACALAADSGATGLFFRWTPLKTGLTYNPRRSTK